MTAPPRILPGGLHRAMPIIWRCRTPGLDRNDRAGSPFFTRSPMRAAKRVRHDHCAGQNGNDEGRNEPGEHDAHRFDRVTRRA